jgi:hypothetical protein
VDLVSADNNELSGFDFVVNLVDFDQHFAVCDDNHGQDIMCMSNEGLMVMSVKHHHVWTSGSAPAFPELAGLLCCQHD